MLFLPFFADHRWGRPYAQDTGNEIGTSESGSEVAVTTERSILEDLASIDPRMIASYLSDLATARHHTVCLVSSSTSAKTELYKVNKLDKLGL